MSHAIMRGASVLSHFERAAICLGALLLGLAASHPSAAQNNVPGHPEVIPFWNANSGFDGFHTYFLVKWEEPENKSSKYQIHAKRTETDQNWHIDYTGNEGRLPDDTVFRSGSNRVYAIRVCSQHPNFITCTSDYSESTSAACAPATVSASSITDDGATLTVANLPARWWYKGEQSGATCTAVANASRSGSTSATITGLDAGTSYTYNIHYRDDCTEDSDKAAHWDVKTTFTTRPAQVTGVTVTPGDRSLSVSWTAVTGATSYKVQWKEDDENWDAANRQTTSTTSSATLSSLTNDTEYTIRVLATSSGGDGAWSDTATGTPVDPPSAPAAPSVVWGNGSATLTWTAPNDNGSPITDYDYHYRNHTDGGSWTEYEPNDTSTATTRSLTGLTNGKEYRFRVRAGNAGGDSNWSWPLVSAIVGAPALVASPTLTQVNTSGRIRVAWTAPSTNGSAITGYSVWHREGQGAWTEVTGVTGAATSHELDLSTGKTYTIGVEAHNAHGGSNVSSTSFTGNVSSITPTSGTLTAGTATADGMTLTIGSWSNDWYYKYTTPDGGSCSATAVTTTSKAVTGLTSNTAYTFRAYSDSGCLTLLAIASAWATLPPKPDKPTLTVGAGSGTVQLASSVGGGSAPLTKWQYKKKESNTWDSDWTDITSTSKTLSYTVSELTGGSAYKFKVRARNASGFGAESDESDSATPNAVTLTAKTATAAGMTLEIAHWSAEWYYQYTTPTGDDCSDTAVPAGTSSKAVTGLESNTAYTFKAYSDSGCSAELASASAWATLPPKAAKPTLAVNVGGGKVKLASSVGGGSAPLTKWQYKKKESNTWDSDWTDITSTSKNLSYTVSELTDGSAYKFKVRARNASGPGETSDESDAATPRAVTLSAGTATAAGMTLTIADWSAEWYYQYTTPTGDDCSDTAVPAGTSSKAVTGLESNTAYTFAAYSDSGCSEELASASAYATLPPKAAKPTLTVGIGSGKVKLASSVGGGSAPLTKWQYKKKKDSGNYDADWTNISGTSTLKTLSYTVSELTDGSAYKFKVRARNASGFGAVSDESDAVTPRAVTLTAKTATAAGMTLEIANWSAEWYYQYTTPSGSCSSQAVPAGTSSKAVTGLDSNTAYTFAAYSDSGCSSLLASASAWATLPPKPAKPTLTVDLGGGKVKLASSVGGGSAPLTKWQYKKKKDSDDYDADWTDITSTSKTLSYTVTGLIDGSAYKFKVRARNASGPGETSDESDAATPRAVTFSAGSATATGMTLTIANWSAAWYYKRTATSTGICTTPAGTSSNTLTLTTLTSNTAYTFKTYSNSNCSTELASTSSYATLPPKAAKPTLAVNVGDGKVKLTSSVGGGSAPLTKWQYKKKESNTWDSDWTDISSTSKTLSYTVSELTDGSAYKFKVRARNASGPGAESDESDSATPRAVTLSASTATAVGMKLTIANWSAKWYYKYTAPDGGDCSSTAVPAGTSSKTLTTLTSNTAYTFAAYSDSGCSESLASASSWATLPKKPSTPAVEAGTGSGKLKLTSSTQGGDVAITKWQYTKDNGTSWDDISSTSKDLEHTVSGLDDDTSYRFRVRVRNANGWSAQSDQSQSVAPKDETLTVGKDTITATGATLKIGNWQAEWYYKYTSPSNGSCSTDAVPAGTSTQAVTGLDSNTAYTYAAYSDGACSTELAAAEAFPTLPPKPAKPTLTVDLGDGKVEVSSSVTGTAALEKWQYKKKKDNGSYDSQWTNYTSTSTSLKHVVSNLTDGSAYKFKVRAWNASGAGAESDESDAATPRAVTLSAGTATATGMTLTIENWSAAWRYRRTAPSVGTCSSEVSAGTSSTAVTGLDSSTAYTFKAYSDTNCSKLLASAPSWATLPPKPATPTMLAGNTELTLSSSVSGGSVALTEWQYKRKVGGGGFDATWTKIDGKTSKTLSHTFTGLTNDTGYSYKVRALNASGAGEESDASQAMAPTDAEFGVRNIGATAATLTISNLGSNLTTWYYQYTSPDGGSCSLAQTGGTATVAGLEKDTSYTFEVYSDATCSTSLGLQVNFTTLERDAPGGTPAPAGSTPPAPGKPTATGGDRQVTLSWTSNGDGGSAITEWEYQQKEGSGDWSSWTDICATASDAGCPGKTSWTITGLTNGTAYRFRMRAVNGAGAGAASPESEAVTPSAAPPAPGKPAVVGGDGRVTLTWASNGDGGSAVTEWEYQQKEGSGDWGSWTGVCATASDADCPSNTSWTVTDLSNGTAYRFRVRAVNANGNGAASPESEAVTPATTPPAPGKPAVVGGTGQVTLTWTSNGDGGSALTEWEYQRKEGSSDWGSWTGVCATASDADCPGKTSWTVAELTNGTAYRFRVRAVNANGNGAASPESEAVTPAAAPPAPGKPTVEAGDGQVTLTWTSNGDGSSAITEWEYQRKEGSGAWGDWADVCETASDAGCPGKTSWTVTNLSNGTVYRFKVRAVNAVGAGVASPQSEPAAPLDASPPAPSPPAAPSAPAVSGGDQSVTLAWTAGDDGGSAVTKWQYVRKEGDNAFETLWTDIPGSGESTTTHTVAGLTNGTAYRFRVRAVNAAGAGAASPESEAVTPAAVPPAPGKPVVEAGVGQVTLTWTSNGNGGSAITEWEYQRKEGSGDWGSWTGVCATASDADCPSKTSWTVPGLSNGTAYRFKVRAVNGVGTGAASPESEAVTPAAAPPGPELRQAVKRTLAAVARRSLSSALDQIGARFAASVPPSGLTLAGRAVTPGGAGGTALAAAGDGACPADGLPRHGFGERLGLAAFGWGDEGCGGWRSRAVTGDELLGGSGFSWLLGAAPDEPGADPSAPLWSVWGRGDLGTFEGRPSGSRYRGELRTGWLGMDARAGPWVAGFAVSHGTGGADYHSDADADAAGGGAEEQGRLETVLTALYPYARWTFPDGLELRGVLGAGTGETRHWPGGGAAREKSGLRMYMASLGARRALPAAAGIDLAARGDASLSRLETGAGPDHIDGLSADTWRARLGLEASRRVALGGDAALTPFVETAVRRDGGDGLTGTGVEVAGGVRYAAPGVQIEARGRWLAAHTEAGARERGASVTARMGPGAHGRGLSLALSPRWGAAGAGGGAQTLWRDELPGSGDSGVGDEAALDARIGYGVFLAPRGLLTPFAEAGLAGGADRRLRLGTRFEAARLDLGVELSGARRESAGGAEHALKLDLDLRF